MMPPVSLPLNGGTVSACAAAQAIRAHTRARPAARIVRIAISIPVATTVERIGGDEKNAGPAGAGLLAGVAAPHLTSQGLHGTVHSKQIRRTLHARCSKPENARRGDRSVAWPACLGAGGTGCQSAGTEFLVVRPAL